MRIQILTKIHNKKTWVFHGFRILGIFVDCLIQIANIRIADLAIFLYVYFYIKNLYKILLFHIFTVAFLLFQATTVVIF